MSTITKQAVQAVADLKAGYTLGHADVEIIQQMALDAVTLLDELDAKDRRIAELSQKADIYDMLRQDYELQGSLVDFVDWQAKRIAELEAREVVLPQPAQWDISEVLLDKGKVVSAIRAAGIRINGEG
ncbi:hypothetical protein [Enterobacter kobei]|uniref:hypothetical protein n=1 Tax=Enterobacter kobei TaxID=208224 RepID=UPI000B8E9D32|nr:hypothetical protein [Enterobacter kobei]OXV23943.1 hypothetical protein CDL31_24730 [Enterobacter kobei]